MFNKGYGDNDTKKTVKVKPIEPEAEEKNPSNSFRKLLKAFASDTSFGGISKATLSDGYIRRLLWLLISATCYGFTIYMCFLSVNTFLAKPIRTAVDIVYEKDIDFPSVTVCNLNQFRQSAFSPNGSLSNIGKIIENYSDDKRNKSDGSSFEGSITKQKTAFKKDLSDDLDDDGEDPGDDIEIDENVLVENLVAIAAAGYSEEELREAGHQFETILSCSWRGFNCLAGYFAKFWAQTWNWKYGNCFTFNPGGNESGYPLNIFRTSKPGPYYGLVLDINIQQDEYVDALTDEAGANIIVHNARQMPFPYEEGITVAPGFSSSIAIRKESITRVDPFKNGSCNAQTKLGKDNIYRSYMNGSAVTYSTKACMESCLATAQLKICDCTEAKFAGFVSRICEELEDLECINNVSSRFKDSKLGCNEKCPQPCQHNSYRYTIMTSTLTKKAKETKRSQDFGDEESPDFDFDGNFLRVKVFYEELNLQKIVQSTYYDLEALLSDIGGQLGLWIGISVISVAEFGELLISLCVVAARKSRKRNRTKTTSEIELH